MAQEDVKHWYLFENVVAGIYRSLGATNVKQNVNLAGNQVDIYVEEQTPSGQKVRVAVECKYFKKQVPKNVVLQFGIIAGFLRLSNLIEKAILVGYHGFTQSAFLAAQAANIELVSFGELQARISRGHNTKLNLYVPLSTWSDIIKEAQQTPIPEEFPNTVFIVMPFAEELEDAYIYGIRKAVHHVGLQCKRADEIEHGGSIIDEIIEQIKKCRLIIAEVTHHNPNVYYEVGWAQALKKDTILIAKEGAELPFDIRHINTILYKTIHELENKLKARLAAIIKRG
jgi:hypothetical protein